MPVTKIVSLCPTFCRPWMVANTLAQWVRQTHPLEDRWLLIGDDADGLGDLSTKRIRDAIRYAGFSDDVAARVFHFRFPANLTLPEKYNRMAEYALQWMCPGAELFTVWEDDDNYVPAHLQQIAHEWNRRNRPAGWWGHPHLVLSDYTRQLQVEQAQGRFHAALAITADAWRRCPWVETDAPNFDQQYLWRLESAFGPRRTYDLHASKRTGQTYSTPSYIFRWHTRCPHGQEFMPDHGTTWQQHARAAMRAEFEGRRGFNFICQMDLSTARLIAEATDDGRQRVSVPQYLPELH